MHKLGRRAWFLLGLGLLAVPMAGAALSHACTGLATLDVSPGGAPSGGTVTVVGRGFSAHDPGDSRTGQPAEIRLDRVSGPVLATAAPGADGTFAVRITVPPANPGDHVITATQTTATGRPSYGTPARQSFTVTPSAAASHAAPGGSSAGSKQAASKVRVGKAVAKCRKKYNVKKARSKRAKRRAAKKLAACVKKAKRA